MEKEFIITEKVINGILNYLATRPYMEVAGLIQAIQSIKPVEVEESPVEIVE